MTKTNFTCRLLVCTFPQLLQNHGSSQVPWPCSNLLGALEKAVHELRSLARRCFDLQKAAWRHSPDIGDWRTPSPSGTMLPEHSRSYAQASWSSAVLCMDIRIDQYGARPMAFLSTAGTSQSCAAACPAEPGCSADALAWEHQFSSYLRVLIGTILASPPSTNRADMVRPQHQRGLDLT